ncbi:hypothetical protein R4Z10_11590 [Niallia sp. XMNu-256]|uniref:hypothetical protein n=1 Tax=Niallia sp. XMNu-256 TaxID=3082444 RepID=UPI0030D22711
MDRISCLAFLLFQVNNKKLQEAALQLVSGDISILELKTNLDFLPFIEEAEDTLKKYTPNKNEVCEFVERYLYVY